MLGAEMLSHASSHCVEIVPCQLKMMRIEGGSMLGAEMLSHASSHCVEIVPCQPDMLRIVLRLLLAEYQR